MDIDSELMELDFARLVRFLEDERVAFSQISNKLTNDSEKLKSVWIKAEFGWIYA